MVKALCVVFCLLRFYTQHTTHYSKLSRIPKKYRFYFFSLLFFFPLSYYCQCIAGNTSDSREVHLPKRLAAAYRRYEHSYARRLVFETDVIWLSHCPTEDMVADMLTKPFSGEVIRHLFEKCGVCDV